jgi:hypothetical protein
MMAGWNRILRAGLVAAVPTAWLVGKRLRREAPSSE